jgi:hypothetical protein
MSIRPAYSNWPKHNQRLLEAIAGLNDEQLALRPTPERWPMWATVGHAACQRVFWLCDFAGEPGAETTRFTDAGHNCPGDDDLDNVLDAGQLVEALDSTFRIVESCLDRWTLEMLERRSAARITARTGCTFAARSFSASSRMTYGTPPS